MKKSIICKDVNHYNINTEINKTYIPKAGDVAVFEVLEVGKHTSIQAVGGNNSYIFPEDHVMMVFGNRYASGQFEGYVPDKYLEEYQVLGKGGAVGELTSMHAKLIDVGPTTLKLVGYTVDENNKVINSKYLNANECTFSLEEKRPEIILSLGSSMDSGKTTSAAFLGRGFSRAGKNVAYIKLTGTVYTKDRSLARDAGAKISLDFSTFGFPSTYLCSEQELLNLYETLLNKTKEIAPDVVIVEIADGLLQRETKMLINNPEFMSTVSSVLFSGGDSMSAMNGIDILEGLNIPIIGISGLFTASPLLYKEVADNTIHKVLSLEELEDPQTALKLNKMKVA